MTPTSEYRHNRLEDAIEKLTEISSDLNKVIAVHEQRLNQQEKQVQTLEDVMEKRREESEVKLKDVYDTIKNEDRNIIQAVDRMREENLTQYEKLQDRITSMEEKIWMYVGGFGVLMFFIAYGPNILGLFGKK